MTTDSLRTIQLRLPRCRSTMILPVDFATSQIKDVVGNALLGEQRDSDFDPSKYRFVVSPTEFTPGMIVSSNTPLESCGIADLNDDGVLEMWQDPDVLRLRLFSWSAGAEDKPTVIDYACPLINMLPIIRKRFASQLDVENMSNENNDNNNVAGSSSPILAATSQKATSLVKAMVRSTSKTRKETLLPEITLRLVENGTAGKAYWLTTARSLNDQGCTPANSAQSILEVHRVRAELLKMSGDERHRALMTGALHLQAYGAGSSKQADKPADGVILLEYFTVHLIDINGESTIQLRRQNIDYSPSHTLSYTLCCNTKEDTRRWYEVIGRQCMPGATRVFGVTLDEICTRENATVPSVVQHCLDYLRAGDRLDTEGLFRKTGFRVVLEYCRDAFDNGGAVALDKVPRNDAVTVAALLKSWFSEMPEPLIPFYLYDAYVATGGDGDKVVALSCAELPTRNLSLLNTLATLLSDVAARSAKNLMVPTALGVVFGPTLLRQREGELPPERLVKDAPICGKVCQAFIERAHELAPTPERQTLRANQFTAVDVIWADNTNNNDKNNNSKTNQHNSNNDNNFPKSAPLPNITPVFKGAMPGLSRASPLPGLDSSSPTLASRRELVQTQNEYQIIPNANQLQSIASSSTNPTPSQPNTYGRLPVRTNNNTNNNNNNNINSNINSNNNNGSTNQYGTFPRKRNIRPDQPYQLLPTETTPIYETSAHLLNVGNSLPGSADSMGIDFSDIDQLLDPNS